MTTEKILSVRQVAEWLGVRVNAVYQYIREEELKAHKLGRKSSRSHWRIYESDLIDFVNRSNGKEKK